MTEKFHDEIPLFGRGDDDEAEMVEMRLGNPRDGRRISPTHARGGIRQRLIMLSGWGVAFVFLLSLMASHKDKLEKLPGTISDMASGRILGNATRNGENECYDVYNTSLGYIWRGAAEEDIRWIPYDIQALRTSRRIPDETEPPDYAIERAAPPYSRWLQKTNLTSIHDGLGFLRNRTIVAVGDSHDRNNVEGFCQQHEASGAIYHLSHKHIKARCTLPQLNFTLANWFHYGLPEESETWYMRDEPGPYSIETRLRDLFVPDTAEIGSPDLIILNSFYWDLRYFGMHAKHYNVPGRSSFERPLTWGELEWHRSRLLTMVDLFRKTFPNAQIMFRLGQKHATNRNGGNIAVFQLNRSIRAAMKAAGVPILEWAALLDGEERYQDDQHLLRGKPAFLFGNMVLYYLHRAVEGWYSC